MTPTPFINQNNYAGFQLKTLADLLNLIVPLLTLGAVLLFGGMLLLMAYRILTAGDDAEQVQKAKSTATYAVIGLLLVMLSFFIVKLIEFITGVDLPL